MFDNWYKNNPTDVIWWKDTPDGVGEWLFSFDKRPCSICSLTTPKP